MKRVLIITYYWPPSGGAGVQRWLKFTKYLRNYGWEPIIYTPENPESPSTDLTLEKDIPAGITVLKTPIFEPYYLYKKFIGLRKEDKVNAAFLSETGKPKRLEKAAVWLRGNFFIPDARAFWIRPSVKYLTRWLKDNPVDAIISTGPPHSMHLIALGVKNNIHIPWLADFRDPWTNIDFYSKLMLTKRADRKHKRLEINVLSNADIVTCVGYTWLQELKEILANYELRIKNYGKKSRNYDYSKFKFISNGYDPDDYESSEPILLDSKFTLSHVGTLDKSRNPSVLWTALSELIETVPGFSADLQIQLAGKTDITVKEEIGRNELTPYLNLIPYLNHKEITIVQKKSQVLLLLINDTPNAMGITTGKLFEYLAAKRPILCIGPHGGDTDKLLSETNAGLLAGFEEKEQLKKNILEFYRQYKNGKLSSHSINLEKYSRKALTGELAQVLNSICSKS
jgi:glycosyltransferase involved in cell wall biosynthesis